MILKFQGPVWVRRGCVCCQEDCDGSCGVEEIEIGGRAVQAEVEIAFPFAYRKGRPHVYVALADDKFDGDLYSHQCEGGYSEYTPGSSADLTVGNHDVFDRLEKMEGQTVTLWIADEPVNTLEDDESV